MTKIYLFANGSDKTTTRVVPVRFLRARPGTDVIVAKGAPAPEDRGLGSGPTVSAIHAADPADFYVLLRRQTLDDDAPLKVVMPARLDMDGTDTYTVPSGHSVELPVGIQPRLKPNADAPYSDDLIVHWLTPNEVELGRLTIKVYKTLEITLHFYIVTVGDKTPGVTEDQIKSYVDVVNAIYEPAALLFKAVVTQVTAPPNVGKAGVVGFNVDIILLFRLATDASPGTINVIIIDTWDSKLGGIGISQLMASKTYPAEVFNTDPTPLGEAIERATSGGLIPEKMTQARQPLTERRWERARRCELHLQSGRDVTNDVTTSVQLLHDEDETQHAARLLKEYIDFLALYNIVFDPDGNIRVNDFADVSEGDRPDPGTGKKLIARLSVPGVLLTVNSKGPSIPLKQVVRWGRILAHELGHFFGLHHPNDPTYSGKAKSDDIWSRKRLMYHAVSFYRDQNITDPQAPPPPATPESMADVRDVGYGVNEPGTFLTHVHIQRGDLQKDPAHAIFLDPPEGEIERIRKNAAALFNTGS
jgi:hypothetical protein